MLISQLPFDEVANTSHTTKAFYSIGNHAFKLAGGILEKQQQLHLNKCLYGMANFAELDPVATQEQKRELG
jgi:hypothetical protein